MLSLFFNSVTEVSKDFLGWIDWLVGLVALTGLIDQILCVLSYIWRCQLSIEEGGGGREAKVVYPIEWSQVVRLR